MSLLLLFSDRLHIDWLIDWLIAREPIIVIIIY